MVLFVKRLHATRKRPMHIRVNLYKTLTNSVHFNDMHPMSAVEWAGAAKLAALRYLVKLAPEVGIEVDEVVLGQLDTDTYVCIYNGPLTLSQRHAREKQLGEEGPLSVG